MRHQPLIMAVDDDGDMLCLLQDLLYLEGFDTVGATDGRRALALIADVGPDLILLDVVMSGLSGLEALPAMRRMTPAPIIMVTARCELALLAEALRMGADDYVTKPFNSADLLAKIRAKLRWIDRYGPPRTVLPFA